MIASIIQFNIIQSLMLKNLFNITQLSIRNHFTTVGKTQFLSNIDFQKMRKDAVQNYNSKLKKQLQLYEIANKKIMNFINNEKNEKELIRAESYYQKVEQLHRKKIQNISKQLSSTLCSITEEEKTQIVKKFLISNIKQEQKSTQAVQKDSKIHIPQRLVLKKLYHSPKMNLSEIKTNHQILLAGVQHEEQHCIFVKRLIDQLHIKDVITMISPDLPFFIKTQSSFTNQWSKFLESEDYAKKSKFFINPRPTNIKDICLHKQHISLVKNSLSKSKSFIETYYYLMQYNDDISNYIPNPFFSGLMAQNVEKIYFADYPAFKEREMIANKIDLNSLRELFTQHVQNLRKDKLTFSAQWLFPKNVLAKKLNHIIGITRAVSEQSNHRSIMICSSEMAELISIEWEKNTKEGRLNYNYQNDTYYFNDDNIETVENEEFFINYVEKLVILDFIMEPIIGKYFIKYRSFPFLCHHTIGGKENIGKIFMVWMHFYKTYYDVIQAKRLSINGSQERKKKIMEKYAEPKNI